MGALFLSSFITFISWTWAIPHPSVNEPQSVPVYLKPYSAIPTGHQNVDHLKSTLIGHDKFRWVYVRDKATGLTGWTPQQNLLTPLHFSSKARLLAQSPVFRQKQDRIPDPILIPKTELEIDVLDVQNDWALIALNQTTPAARSPTTAWVTTNHLYPIDKDAGYFFARVDQHLRREPLLKSPLITPVQAGQRLRPLGTQGGWVRVVFKTANGSYATGYLLSQQIVSRIDTATKVKTQQGFEPPRHELIHQKIFAIYVNPLWLGSAVHPVPLFSEPKASSEVVGYVKPWQNLTQQDSTEQIWAASKSKDLGTVWWQVPADRNKTQLTKLSLSTLKKIKENPIYKHIKVAAAKGLYRSIDGVHWKPLQGFQGYNPPFTYAKDGVLFVEDKVSFDNGEHFTPFVFWENLLRTLRENQRGIKKDVKILNIETANNSSQQLILELDIGSSRSVKMYTSNRGQTWALLNR